MNSNRYGESRAAYREVQERHQDIQRIEKTLGELAQLFNDVRMQTYLSHADGDRTSADERSCRTTGRDNNCDRNSSGYRSERYGNRVCATVIILRGNILTNSQFGLH
jgi:hypothetical protein